ARTTPATISGGASRISPQIHFAGSASARATPARRGSCRPSFSSAAFLHSNTVTMESSMIDHLSIGVQRLDRARQFYDATLGAIGCRCLSADKSSLGYGSEAAVFWLYAV